MSSARATLDIVHPSVLSVSSFFHQEPPVPARGLSIGTIRDVLLLKFGVGLRRNQIARRLGIAQGSVTEYLGRAALAGLAWPLPEDRSDEAPEAQLFSPVVSRRRARPAPEWAAIHAERARKGDSLELLWQEYRSGQPDGYGYSHFCSLYRRWRSTIDVVSCVRRSGPRKNSSSTTQDRPSRCTTRRLARSGPCRSSWQPTVPATPPTSRQRSLRPCPPSSPPTGVLVVEQWILAVLRVRQFTSLEDINDAIAPLLTAMNDRPFQKRPGSRRTAFESIHFPAPRRRANVLKIARRPLDKPRW